MITPGGFQPTSRCTYKPGGATGDYVRFAPITTKFVRQRSMSRWASSGSRRSFRWPHYVSVSSSSFASLRSRMSKPSVNQP